MASESIIFFDGECNLCNGFVQFVLKHEQAPNLKFSSLQSEFAQNFFKQQNFDPSSIDSVIVYHNNQFYLQSKAAFIVIAQLKSPYKWLSVFKFIPSFIANFIYKIIARYRYNIWGKTNQCWVMKPNYQDRFL
ncbi:MAG: DCC1-like thiol-disulfide oxidoreductase family protein [Bacteroidota bacterium]